MELENSPPRHLARKGIELEDRAMRCEHERKIEMKRQSSFVGVREPQKMLTTKAHTKSAPIKKARRRDHILGVVAQALAFLLYQHPRESSVVARVYNFLYSLRLFEDTFRLFVYLHCRCAGRPLGERPTVSSRLVIVGFIERTFPVLWFNTSADCRH